LPRDPDTFRLAAMLLRHHAIQTCGDDPHCTVCPLAQRCPSRRI
jgi:endonuclease III